MDIDNAYELYSSERCDIFYSMMHEFKTSGRERQWWNVISAPKLIKSWKDFVKYGFVRETRVIDEFQEKILRNTIQLELNTELGGHTSSNPKDILLEFEYEMSDEDLDKFFEYAVCSRGQWALSDYGLPKIQKLLFELMTTSNYEEKLVLIDRILNVVHQRGDLAEFFVEGGSETLSNLSS